MNIIGCLSYFSKKRNTTQKDQMKEELLTLKNLYESYKFTLNKLEQVEIFKKTEELQQIKNNTKTIEQQIARLNNLLER